MDTDDPTPMDTTPMDTDDPTPMDTTPMDTDAFRTPPKSKKQKNQ